MKFIKQKKLKNKVFCEIFGKHAVYAAIKNNNRKHQKLYFWSGRRESNPRNQLGRLELYH